MDNLTILATLRNLAKATTEHCDRQEFKPEVIYAEHNKKVNNLKMLVNNNSRLNGKQKAKINAEITKIILAPMAVKSYYLIKAKVADSVKSLTSAIEFRKK